MLYSQREHVEEITDERWYKTIKKEVYDSLGVEYFHVGDYKKALKYYQLALSIAKDTGDKRKQARAYGNLGIVYCELGDLKKAEEYFQQCLSIAKDAGDYLEQAHAYGHLGNIHCTVGNFKTAMEYCQQSLSIAEYAGDKRRQGEAYGGLASIHFSLGDFNKALEHYQQSLSIAKDIGDKGHQARACCNLGNVYSRQGDVNTALEYYQQFLSISKDSGHKIRQALAYQNLGQLYIAIGDLSKAEDCLKSSVDLYDNIRELLHSRDDWKITLRNHHRDVYNALWAIQLERNKIIEALSSAERGRAQALMDLLKSNYGVELAQSSWLAENTEAIADILSYLPSQTVFLAIAESSINFWVLEKGKEIHFTNTTFNGNTFQEEGIIFVQSWIEKVFTKLLNALSVKLLSVKCEDRCLDGLPEDEVPVQRSQETASLHSKKEALKE